MNILEGFKIISSGYDGRTLLTDIKNPWTSQCTRIKSGFTGCCIFIRDVKGILQTCNENISMERLSILEISPFTMSKHEGQIWVFL